MANQANILLFLSILAFSSQVGCDIFQGASGLDPQQCATPMSNILSLIVDLTSQLNTILGVVTAAGLIGAIVFGSIFFPNPFTTFALIAVAMLGFAILPSSGFAFLGIPTNSIFNQFLTTAFQGMWIYSVLTFYKGND